MPGAETGRYGMMSRMAKRRSVGAIREPVDNNRRNFILIGILGVVTVLAVSGGLFYDSARSINADTATENLKPLTVVRPADGPLKALFIGDSLTAGLYASSESQGFRSQMVAALEQSGPVELSLGQRIGGTVGEISEITNIGSGNQLAVVELGTNDFGKTDLDVFEAQYARLLDAIRATSPDAALVCAGVWQARYYGGPFDAIIARQCAEHGGKYRVLNDLYADADNRGPAGVEAFGGVSDDFHPNDDGYGAISERLLGVLTLP
ncbi:MAG: SGNH/GDSL hydrolase family protein [Rhodococcus sp. (in: high G+C Gram-positive bacteria)]|nr:SGNH/GDSL hydrolase family protein [Rhodococcus sp. (in: high G+C Gram-positive bacteria)]